MKSSIIIEDDNILRAYFIPCLFPEFSMISRDLYYDEELDIYYVPESKGIKPFVEYFWINK